jgi:hypothetical protein
MNAYDLSRTEIRIRVWRTQFRLLYFVNEPSPELLERGSPYLRKPYLPQDVWALGILFHALLTGGLPFVASSREDLRRRIVDGKLPVSLEAIFKTHQICIRLSFHRTFPSMQDK